MKTSSPRSYIHYDPERIDYSLSKQELLGLRNACQNNWKDFAIACFSVGVPCIINSISLANSMTPFQPSLAFTLNAVAGAVGLVLGAAFCIAWFNTKTSVDALVQDIMSKPKLEMPLSFTDFSPDDTDSQQTTLQPPIPTRSLPLGDMLAHDSEKAVPCTSQRPTSQLPPPSDRVDKAKE